MVICEFVLVILLIHGIDLRTTDTSRPAVRGASFKSFLTCSEVQVVHLGEEVCEVKVVSSFLILYAERCIIEAT